MSLLELQQALARLYTEPALRAQFVENPQQTGLQLGLSDIETQQLEALSRERLEMFAQSLAHKRFHGVQKLLPHSARAWGPDFETLFKLYASTYVPTGSQKSQDDALHFVQYLRAALKNKF